MSLRHNLVPHHFNAIRIIPGEPQQIILKNKQENENVESRQSRASPVVQGR